MTKPAAGAAWSGTARCAGLRMVLCAGLTLLPTVLARTVRSLRSPTDEHGRPASVVFDLDGTLVRGRWPGLGDWLPGAREALRAFLDAGYRVRVHSCRLHSHELDEITRRNDVDLLIEQGRVRKLLTDAGFPEVEIVFTDKTPAVLYIDDKGLRFEGSWRKTLRQVKRLGIL